MKLTKTINSVSDLRAVPDNDKFFGLIEQWKALYSVYFSEWHDVNYTTVNGPKKKGVKGEFYPYQGYIVRIRLRGLNL